MSPEGLLFGVMLYLGAGMGSYYLHIFIIDDEIDPKYITPCEQKMTPNNSVAYFSQPDLRATLEWLGTHRFIEDEVADNAEYIYRKFQTVIFNCPPAYQNYSSIINVALRALASFNSENAKTGREPMTLWLRLQNDQLLESEDYIADCAELAVFGNKMYPRLVSGIIINREMLWDAMQLSKSPKNKNRGNVLASSRYLKRFRVSSSESGSLLHDLKFGLMVNPANCHIFANKIPENIFTELSEVFYFNPEPLNITSRDNGGLTVTAPNHYGGCRNDFGSKGASFRYTFPTDMVSLFGKIEMFNGDISHLCVNHEGINQKPVARRWTEASPAQTKFTENGCGFVEYGFYRYLRYIKKSILKSE